MVPNSERSLTRHDKTQRLIDPALYSQIKQLHFKTKRLASDILAGQYRSAFKGRGIEFEEVREYVPGDEIRSIDWKVTARAGRPFIKSFREERELTVVLAVDISGSTRTATTNITREGVLAQVGALLSLVALNNNDKVGLCTYTDRIESYYPPRKGRSSVWRILHEVLSPATDHRATDINLLFNFLSSVLKRKSILFILSDTLLPNLILSDQQAQEKLLSTFQTLTKRHDTTVITVEDPIDFELPNVGLLNIFDPELGTTRTIDTSSAALRRNYREQSLAHQAALQSFIEKSRAKHLKLSTARSFTDDLARYFSNRSQTNR